RLVRRQIVIQLFHGSEEALAFFFPRKRQGILPVAVAFGHGEGPVHEVADVGEDPYRRARSFAATVIGKARPCVADGFRSPIGEGGEGVSQEGAVVGTADAAFLSSRYVVTLA